MIHALALTAAALLSQPEPSVLQPRASAARLLRQTIEDAQGQAQLATWIEAGEAAIEELGPGAFSDSLEHALVAARWRALTDGDHAAEILEQELRRAVDDLEFRPVREAELPLGFPEPTPVREIELKLYPQYRMVRAEMGGRSSNGAFWKLFQHIKKNDIAMTAPVEMTYDEGQAWNEAEMAFLYGDPAMGDLGHDGSVEVVDIAPAWYLSIGCRGRMNRASLDAARERLLGWVAGQDRLEVAGEFRSMGYNSPMVPNSRRYFEVQLPMRRKQEAAPARVLIDFSEARATKNWSPVNDGVMGGLSTSQFVSSGEGSAVFEGFLSLENNGGFASVRTRPHDMGLQEARGLRLTARGDGKTYKLRLRTNNAFDGVNYELAFHTQPGEWQEHSFAFEDFKPVWRGRLVRDAGQLVPEDVRSVGLMISDKQVGPFRLEVSSLSAE